VIGSVRASEHTTVLCSDSFLFSDGAQLVPNPSRPQLMSA
jgi:hypothetical protein